MEAHGLASDVWSPSFERGNALGLGARAVVVCDEQLGNSWSQAALKAYLRSTESVGEILTVNDAEAVLRPAFEALKLCRDTQNEGMHEFQEAVQRVEAAGNFSELIDAVRNSVFPEPANSEADSLNEHNESALQAEVDMLMEVTG